MKPSKIAPILVLTILGSIHADADTKNSFGNEAEVLRYISKNYQSGYCDIENLRNFYEDDYLQIASLLALGDALGYSLNKLSMTGAWIGNFRIFKVGKTVNPYFNRLMILANNPETKNLILKDIADIENEMDTFDEALKRLINSKSGIIKQLKAERLKSLAPTPAPNTSPKTTKDEFTRLVYRPILCFSYEMVMIENSYGGKILSDYYNSAMPASLYKTAEAAQEQ